MPKASNFVELKDTDPIRQPPSTKEVDDDQLSLASEDIDIEGSTKAKKSVKEYISDKKAAVADFNPKAFVETKKHQIETFSLEEFMSDKRKVLIKAVAGEFLVTTLFLFIVCAVGLNVRLVGHADSESLVVGALTTGFASVALIYSFADVSGAHFNPAVTFATIVTGKTSLLKGCLYITAQLFASLFAMLLLTMAYPAPKSPENLSVAQSLVIVPATKDIPWLRVFVMEFMLTFILVYVIFAVAFDTVNTNPTVKVVDEKGNEAVGVKKAKNLTIYTASGNTKAGFAPLSIGLTLGFLCFLGGSVSGGAFNPARVFGSNICSGNHLNHWATDWLYWVSDFAGAAAAGLIQQKIFATKQEEQK